MGAEVATLSKHEIESVLGNDHPYVMIILGNDHHHHQFKKEVWQESLRRRVQSEGRKILCLNVRYP